ncbi:hypothetical protein NE237_013559 [Protea cynaroides]|uniref:Disease resistance protein winged helix domain-containing protein n=1 Tax=Protea cynaroides TaxID=273540 RepID=A0A9Q0JYN2_9MAGN|nr:hypothetical protein NE237_013559 [Protea cynaroides]
MVMLGLMSCILWDSRHQSVNGIQDINPVLIVVFGGLLATKQSIREWEKMTKDIGRHLSQPQEQHGVSWILSLSYHDLLFYLKPFFLFLGLYLEDTVFHQRELIQMWIAKGFVQQSAQGTTMEEMGEE